MRFWDSSALIPLCTEETASATVHGLLDGDLEIVVWWGSLIECWSALARRRRDGVLTLEDEDAARVVLERMRAAWSEIQPIEEVRTHAARLLRTHALRSQDAAQLAAALVWAGGRPGEFVVLDQRLREIARREGFVALP